MARRRRPGSRTSVVDGRARLVVPVEAFTTADDQPLTWQQARRFLPAAVSFSATLQLAPSVSLTVDRFAYDLLVSDLAVESDTHDGDAFIDAVRATGEVSVFIVNDADPRRSKPDELEQFARDGRVVGGRVPAFEIDMIDP